MHLALVQRLRAQAAEVRRLAAGLDESVLATHSVPGKWSMHELICHFRRMESIFGERFSRMLTEEATIVPYDNPDADEAFIALTKTAGQRGACRISGRARSIVPKARGALALRMAPKGEAPAVSAL